MENQSTKDKGKSGEEMACEFLRNKGYLIKERNWRFSRYEIDIIAEHKGEIIFIEVKFRQGHPVKDPIIVVSQKQRFNLIKAANYYIDLRSINAEARFDIIEIVEKDGKAFFHHSIEAFTPDVNQY